MNASRALPLRATLALLLAQTAISAQTGAKAAYDIVIRGGVLYDGSGRSGFAGDLAISGDAIAAIGTIPPGAGTREIDARGLAVAPGFINVLSQTSVALMLDGRSQSDIRQGVTLEVVGEGASMGPLNEAMRRDAVARSAGRYEVSWKTLGDYLDAAERRGMSCNLASYVGAGSVRLHEIGYEDRAPTPAELARMQDLVRQAMREGAMGLSTALIYTPGVHSKTDELVALASAAAEYGGIYVSHLRSEGDRFIEALDELIHIARAAKIRAHVFHLKMAGRDNWGKFEPAVRRIEDARAAGLQITADMYCYTAAHTGLDTVMPPWVREGGMQAWMERLRQPAVRERLRREMAVAGSGWENNLVGAGSPDNIRLAGFRSEALKPLTGKTLGEISRLRGTPPADTAMDLVLEDASSVLAIFFVMSEDNVRRQIRLPWMGFASDAESQAPEGEFLRSLPHPRAYGNVARLLGQHVREEKLIPLEDAIRRLTGLPADNLRLDRRGRLAVGNFADVVAFDPATVKDHATYDDPRRYATGVSHVFVNGVQVLRDGEHTGALPGKAVRGPGWRRP